MLRSLLQALLGTGFIFAMSLGGSALVFFSGGELRGRGKSLVMGFAAGLMSAAAVWSLLLPAMERCEALGTVPGWLCAGLGLLAGAVFLALSDLALRRRGGGASGGGLLFTAITLHNVPEGMAVGLAFALASDSESMASAAALAFGIGVQNFPEGAAVSLPLRQLGLSRGRAFAKGALAGAVEPLFGILAVLAAAWALPLMPWLLSFAAGAMLYVSVDELIPDSPGAPGSFSYMAGFALMMALDAALG